MNIAKLIAAEEQKTVRKMHGDMQTPRTLYDIARASNNEDFKKVLITFANASPLFKYLPFYNLPGGAFVYNTEGALPQVTFLGSTDSSASIVNPCMEVLKIVGGDIDVDTAIVRMRGNDTLTDLRHMKIRALSLKVANTFIHGNCSIDSREFDGLATRLTPKGFISWGSEPFCKELAKLARAVPGAVLFMSKANRRELYKNIRDGVGDGTGYGLEHSTDDGNESALTFTYPVVDGDVTKLATARVDILDYNHLGERVLTNNEVYAVRFGENAVVGIQNGSSPDITDFGVISAMPVFRMRFEWLMSFMCLDGGSVRKLVR